MHLNTFQTLVGCVFGHAKSIHTCSTTPFEPISGFPHTKEFMPWCHVRGHFVRIALVQNNHMQIYHIVR